MMLQKIWQFCFVAAICVQVNELHACAAWPQSSMQNSSPWLPELHCPRSITKLAHNDQADVVIVGGGIAGIVTAYFLLEQTTKTIILVEAARLAYGATGHNAGQLTTYFEKPLHVIAQEFGLNKAIEGQLAVESAWQLLESIFKKAHLKTGYNEFLGYDGFTTVDQISSVLEDNYCRLQAGKPFQQMIVLNQPEIVSQIPARYKSLYITSSREYIQNLLHTKDASFKAVLPSKKGCMNSALFVEELAAYLLNTYPQRFKLFEESPVMAIDLAKSNGAMQVGLYKVVAKNIVLCTNGFKHFAIQGRAGCRIARKFDQMITGRIGYMIGYIEKANHPALAFSHYVQPVVGVPAGIECPYFYLTRRNYKYKYEDGYQLVAIGGPEHNMPPDVRYESARECPQGIYEVIHRFLQSTYQPYHSEKERIFFCWHGLMGYTPTKLRVIGYEPLNRVLMYNLGCNGVGILPSIYGAYKIAALVQGVQFNSSIFDA